MKLEFSPSEPFTIGVEIELQILDADSYDLTPQSQKILKLCEIRSLERVKTEIHQSMLEIDSKICRQVKECRQDLETRLNQLQSIVIESGLHLGITGTHPFQCWEQRLISNDDRYQYLHEKFQWLARRMNIYGVHVHIGIPSKSRVFPILQAMVPYLPIFLALSANSPFWQGIDTGMQSSRVSIVETFPYSGIPPYFSKWSEFERFYQTLHKNNAIRSLKDLYWYIRPNLDFGTVELRICDALPTLSETMSLVSLIHCLSVWINKQLDANSLKGLDSEEYHWLAPHNLWVAARDGLEGIIIEGPQGTKRKISEFVLELIEKLKDTAKELNCEEELQGLAVIIAKGTGAQRQRECFKIHSSLKEVVVAMNREFYSDLKACH